MLGPGSVAIIRAGLTPHPPWIIHKNVSEWQLLVPRWDRDDTIGPELRVVVLAEDVPKATSASTSWIARLSCAIAQMRALISWPTRWTGFELALVAASIISCPTPEAGL